MKENIVAVVGIKNYKVGYRVVKYIVSGEEYGCQDIEMRSAFILPKLEYIGDPVWAHRLVHKFGITEQIQSIRGRHEIEERSISEEAKRLLSNDLMRDYSFSPVCSIGFNPTEQKWYGWSHRAIYGFGIGSEVKFGNCAYVASNKEDFIEDFLYFWEFDKDGKEIRTEHSLENVNRILHIIDTDVKDPNGEIEELGVLIRYETTFKDPNQGYYSTQFRPYPEEWGRGEWTAKSLDDAKQMAIEFSRGVS